MSSFICTILPFNDYVERLTNAGIRHAEHEIYQIVASVLDLDEVMLASGMPVTLTDQNRDTIAHIIAQREARVPLERIMEATRFCGLRLRVQAGIYKPYQESEDVILHALELFADRSTPLHILDLGTGCGCLLLALLQALPRARGIGVDNNPDAIVLAETNARANQLESRASFRWGDWSQALDEMFDLVVCNPPRVRSGDISRLTPEMRNHDPHTALDGGIDGLTFFRLLAADFRRLLKPGGYGVVQIGSRRVDDVVTIFHKVGCHPMAIKTNLMNWPCTLIYSKPVQARGSWRHWIAL